MDTVRHAVSDVMHIEIRGGIGKEMPKQPKKFVLYKPEFCGTI